MPVDLWSQQYPPCSASDSTSFAYSSTVTRWPTIVTSIIDHLANLNGTTNLSEEGAKDKVEQGKEIIRELAGLIYEMRHDRALTDIKDGGFPDDAKLYNAELKRASGGGHGTWFTASWLFAECYMYRRIRTLFASAPHWSSFDPFLAPKLSAFRSSHSSIVSLSTSLHTLVTRGPAENTEQLHDDYKIIMDTCLWGNATDLSLLTSLTHEELQALQSTERGANFVLKDDSEAVWEHLRKAGKGRIDIVLDNSGFELYTDLVLADWFITLSPFCTEMVFHPKLIPWFVSDVVPHDFSALLASLLSPEFFPEEDRKKTSAGDQSKLVEMVERWQSYIKSGKFKLSVPWELNMGEQGTGADFWTAPNAFCDLPELAPALLEDLAESNLVIFKDEFQSSLSLLTSKSCPDVYSLCDATWPTTTPFVETLGPLKGKINLLSLRTCKADVCVGLPEGRSEELDKEDPNWRVSGKYAVVSFSAKE